MAETRMETATMVSFAQNSSRLHFKAPLQIQAQANSPQLDDQVYVALRCSKAAACEVQVRTRSILFREHPFISVPH